MQVDPHHTSHHVADLRLDHDGVIIPVRADVLGEDRSGASLKLSGAARVGVEVDRLLGLLDMSAPPRSLASWAAGSSPACPLALLATVRRLDDVVMIVELGNERVTLALRVGRTDVALGLAPLLLLLRGTRLRRLGLLRSAPGLRSSKPSPSPTRPSSSHWSFQASSAWSSPSIVLRAASWNRRRRPSARSCAPRPSSGPSRLLGLGLLDSLVDDLRHLLCELCSVLTLVVEAF